VPAASATPAPTLPADPKSPTPPPSLPPRPSAVSLTFRAANLAFDKTVVHVSAGATVTATLQNDDAGVEHNLTFSLPGLPHGETCKGPCTETQTFKAETAGSYFFLCTIHDMVGTFVIDP
jgi:plastocyanin